MHFDNKLLRTNGFLEIQSSSEDQELISIANQIGNIVDHPNRERVFTLKPKTKVGTVKGTFSNRFGHSEFPFHTDTAFILTPVRYLLFHNVEKSTCDTILISFQRIIDALTTKELENLERAIFLVKTNQISFYTSLLLKANDEIGIRYDQTCMFPSNKSAKFIEPIIQNILSACKPLSINWTGNKTVIIDNWKNLHGRKAIGTDTSRELKRIYIN